MALNDDRSPRSSISKEEAELKSVKDSHLFENVGRRMRTNGVKEEGAADDFMAIGRAPSKSASHSPVKATNSPDGSDVSQHEAIVGGEILLKMEPGQPPKLARSSSQKIPARPTQLFSDYANKTEEAKGVFEVIQTCSYSSKYMGATEHGMDCDCPEEWGKAHNTPRYSLTYSITS